MDAMRTLPYLLAAIVLWAVAATGPALPADPPAPQEPPAPSAHAPARAVAPTR